MASGDLKTALTAQRDHLIACLGIAPADKAAPLHARLTDVLLRLDGLAAPKGSKRDELAAAREKRRTGS